MKIGDKYYDSAVSEIAIEILEIKDNAVVSKIIMGPCAGVVITDTIDHFYRLWIPFS